jgi:uncharacterized damage-inducible protein DinB
MTLSEARVLFAYSKWANGLFLEAAAGLSEEEFTRSIVSSHPSFAATLAHIVSVEWVWLRRWRGESPKSPPAWVTSPELAVLRSKLAEVERERDGFLADLPDDGLERAVAYQTMSGQAHADALSDQVRQVVNHSTYHRGQLATDLRQLGRTPPSTDFIAYRWQAQSGGDAG